MDTGEQYDVFLSHAHEDQAWVEALAQRLTDERGIRVWLDRWVLVPGQSWQQGIAKGLEHAGTCAVCLGEKTPTGWFRQEVEQALNMQTHQPAFRVIPVLLPDVAQDPADILPPFLDLRTWADYRNGNDPEYAFHVLVQGIKGQPIGRWPRAAAQATESKYAMAARRLRELRELTQIGGVADVVATEYQQKILSRWLEEEN
jgi:TIR domain